MKHERTEAVPATTRTVVDHYTCDMCGERIEAPSDPHESSERTIKRETHHNYHGEYGDVKVEEFDICNACWDSNLVTWLTSQGVALRVRETDW